MMIERDPDTGRFAKPSHMSAQQVATYLETYRALDNALHKARIDIAWVCSKQK